VQSKICRHVAYTGHQGAIKRSMTIVPSNHRSLFFLNKVRHIKSALSPSLAGQQFEPRESDQSFDGALTHGFQSSVTATVVERLVESISSKSSPPRLSSNVARQEMQRYLCASHIHSKN